MLLDSLIEQEQEGKEKREETLHSFIEYAWERKREKKDPFLCKNELHLLLFLAFKYFGTKNWKKISFYFQFSFLISKEKISIFTYTLYCLICYAYFGMLKRIMNDFYVIFFLNTTLDFRIYTIYIHTWRMKWVIEKSKKLHCGTRNNYIETNFFVLNSPWTRKSAQTSDSFRLKQKVKKCRLQLIYEYWNCWYRRFFWLHCMANEKCAPQCIRNQ